MTKAQRKLVARTLLVLENLLLLFGGGVIGAVAFSTGFEALLSGGIAPFWAIPITLGIVCIWIRKFVEAGETEEST